MHSGSDRTRLGWMWMLMGREKLLSWQKGATAKRIAVSKGTASVFLLGLTVGTSVVVMYTRFLEVIPRTALITPTAPSSGWREGGCRRRNRCSVDSLDSFYTLLSVFVERRGETQFMYLCFSMCICVPVSFCFVVFIQPLCSHRWVSEMTSL